MARSVLKSYLWSFLEQGSTKIVSMIVQIVLARLLDPEAFGVLAILLVVTHLADSIAQSGMGLALIQKNDASGSSFSTGWWLSLGLASVMYVIIFLIAPFVSDFYSMPDLVVCLRVLGLVVFVNSANSIQRSYMQRTLDFRGLFRISLAAIIVSGIVGVCCAVAGFGLWSLIAQTLAQSLATLFAMLLFVPWKPALVFKKDEAKELYSYGWKMCVTGLLGTLYSGISGLVLGRVCSVEELGYYSNGQKYPESAIGIMTNAISNVMFPAFASLKDDLSALRSSMRKSLKMGSFLVIPFSILCAVVAKPTIAILLGEKWLPCVPVFQMMCVGNALLIMQMINLRCYMALGDSARYMRINVVKVFIGGGLIWATAAISHSIYATAASNLAVSILGIIFVDAHAAKKVHGYSALQQVKDVLPVLLLALAASAAGLAVQLLGLGYALEPLLQCVVFTIVYLGGAKLLGFKELSEAVSLAQGLVSKKG